MFDGFQRGHHAGTSFCRAGSGPVLVFIHGVGMNAEIWAPQLAAFAPGWDVLAYDILGHGGSSLPPACPNLGDYSAQLLALLNALDIAEACLVGHSMGALIALEFALAHPARVRGVVPMNAVYRRDAMQAQAVAVRAAQLEAGEATADWRQAALDRWFGKPIPPAQQENAALVGAALAALDPVGYAAAYRLFAGADTAHAGRLSTLAMPALFLTGAEDFNSTPEMSRRMAAEARYGRALVLPNERHMMSVTAPVLVNAALTEFLAEIALLQAAQ